MDHSLRSRGDAERRGRFFLVLAGVSMLCCTACAPGLGRSLKVNRIPEAAGENLAKQYEVPLKVQVERFEDQRRSPVIAEIDGREIVPDGDVGVEVQQAIERQLQTSGVRLAIAKSPILRGGVTSWRADIKPGFPSSTVQANATIRVELLDEDNNKLYSAVYSGNALEEHPMLSEYKIESALGGAMANAIREALRDERLVQQIRR